MAAFSPKNRPIDALHYRIQLEIDPRLDPTEFEATTEITLKARLPLKSFSLDIEELSIKKVSLSGKILENLAYQTKKEDDSESLEIELPKALKKGEQIRLAIRYSGKIRSAHNGFFKVKDPDEPRRGTLLFTHFEALSARSFFPCNDEPYDKASTEIEVLVPHSYEAISNGHRMPDKERTRQNEKWREIRWLQDKPHATYLVSLAIGPFAKITDASKKPEISIWVGETKTERAEYALEVTRKSLIFFESYLGSGYPWIKYDTIGLPTFLWGGMENTSATHMNQERTLLNDPNSEFEKKRILALAAHELAHQWFGNSVTMKWWDDLWLNESFASRMETLAGDHIFKNGEAEIDLVTTTWDEYFREEDGPRSHPIVSRELSSVDDAFDATTYTKGENVLKMLAFYVGEENFRKGLKDYLKTHGFSNATYRDFFGPLERVSGKKLAAFRDTWLLQRGYPVLTYGGFWNQTTRTYELTLSQKCNHAQDRSLFTFKLPVVFHREHEPAYSKQIIVKMEKTTKTVKISLPAAPQWVTVNPGSIVLAKLSPSEPNQQELSRQALKDPDPIARLWAALELVRGVMEGEPIPELAQNVFLKVLGNDSSPYVRNALLVSFEKMKSRTLPELLGNGIFALTRKALDKGYEKTSLFLSDPHGWRQYKSQLIGILGRVEGKKEVLELLTPLVQDPNLALDDLGEAALSIARLGETKSAELLKATLKIHEKRGYRYQYLVIYAFGAYENPGAASEIKAISENYGSDLMGRIGWVVRDNQTLKNSPEWASFLQDFLLNSERFGDEVKTRVLQTIEEVKTTNVKTMLERVVQKSTSDRLKAASKKILEKNFQS